MSNVTRSGIALKETNCKQHLYRSVLNNNSQLAWMEQFSIYTNSAAKDEKEKKSSCLHRENHIEQSFKLILIKYFLH
jgi:hypothetical protein